MSSNLAYSPAALSYPVRRPREDDEQDRPAPQRVRIVTTRAQRRARPKIVYALGATGIIFAIFLAQLLITISLSSGAYQIDGLQSSSQNLGRTASALGERLETLSSSQNLEANAKALGMVGSANSAFLRLSDGAALGHATPAHSGKVSTQANGSTDSVANSLLTDIPVVAIPSTPTQNTGKGHGGSNTADAPSSPTESTKGQTAPTQVGTTTPAPSNAAPANPNELPSPVTH